MSTSRMRLPWSALALLLALAFALRAIGVAQYEDRHPLAQRPGIDEASYDSWAREIAAGELVGREIFFQEPLYPYVLGAVYAAAGDEPQAQRSAARWLQAALGALTAIVAAALAARCFGRAAGWVGGLAVALHRPAVWFPELLLKENMFLLVLSALALWLVASRGERPRWSAREFATWLGLGALAAVGALLRGNLLVLLPLLALWPVARALCGRSWGSAALAQSTMFGLGAFLVLLPVALRNQHVGGRFVLTTSGAGTNFYGGNNLDNPYGVATEFDWVRGIPEHEAGDWRHEASRRVGRALDPTETSAYWLDAAFDSMKAEPAEHARILWRKLRLTLGSYEVPDNHFLEWDARFVPILRWPLPGFALTGTLALAGALAFLWLASRREEDELTERGAALEVLILAGLYLGTVVLTVTSERVRLPLVPLLAPFAGWFTAALFDGSRRTLALLPAALIAAPFVLLPVLPESERSADFDERDYNLAVTQLASGDIAGAEELVGGLSQRHASSPRVQLLLAELDYRRARALLDGAAPARRIPVEAGEGIESALRKLEAVARRGNAQERYRADLLSGAIRQYMGNWKDAELSYRSALAFDPEDRDLRRRLAVVIAERGMQLPAGAQRVERLREAILIVERLVEEQSDPELAALLERFGAQL